MLLRSAFELLVSHAVMFEQPISNMQLHPNTDAPLWRSAQVLCIHGPGSRSFLKQATTSDWRFNAYDEATPGRQSAVNASSCDPYRRVPGKIFVLRGIVRTASAQDV
jgi:hypothetical protein